MNLARQILRAVGNVFLYSKITKMIPVEKKAEELNLRNKYRLHADGLQRIVFATDNYLQEAAFEYAIQLADKTGSLLDILYAYSEEDSLMNLPKVLWPLEKSGLDFQIT